MTPSPHKSAVNSWMESDLVRKAHLQRIEMLAEAHNNPDSYCAPMAADRLCEGRAAFWSRTGYSDQFTGGVCDAANRLGDLIDACDEMQVWTKQRASSPIEMLDRLIPLNEPAREQLEATYNRAGTFRTEHTTRPGKVGETVE